MRKAYHDKDGFQALAMIAKFDLGDTGCKIVLGMTNLNLNASVLFVTGQVIEINFLINNSENKLLLTYSKNTKVIHNSRSVMTIDRYLAVLYGPQKSSFRKWRAKSSVQLQVPQLHHST